MRVLSLAYESILENNMFDNISFKEMYGGRRVHFIGLLVSWGESDCRPTKLWDRESASFGYQDVVRLSYQDVVRLSYQDVVRLAHVGECRCDVRMPLVVICKEK